MKQPLNTLILLTLMSPMLLAAENLKNCKFDTNSRLVVAENCKKLENNEWLVLPCLAKDYCKVNTSVSASAQTCPATTEPRPQVGIKLNYDYHAAFINDVVKEAKQAASTPPKELNSKQNLQAKINERCILSSKDSNLQAFYASRKSQGEGFIPMFAFGSFVRDLQTNTQNLKEILSSEKCKNEGPEKIGFEYIQVFSKNRGEYNFIKLSDLSIISASDVYPNCK